MELGLDDEETGQLTTSIAVRPELTEVEQDMNVTPLDELGVGAPCSGTNPRTGELYPKCDLGLVCVLGTCREDDPEISIENPVTPEPIGQLIEPPFIVGGSITIMCEADNSLEEC